MRMRINGILFNYHLPYVYRILGIKAGAIRSVNVLLSTKKRLCGLNTYEPALKFLLYFVWNLIRFQEMYITVLLANSPSKHRVIFRIQNQSIYSRIICLELPDSIAYSGVSSISKYPLRERQLNPWKCSFVRLSL